MTNWYKTFLLAAAKAVVDVEADEGEVDDVVEAPAVVAGGASGAFSPRPLGQPKVAKVVAKMARSPVFATKAFCLMVKQRRTTLLMQRRARRAWPPTPSPLLLRGPEK